jgi:hypothetical protein
MWYYNYYVAILIISLIFFIISGNEVKILLSIIIIIIISYYYFTKINDYNDLNLKNQDNIIKSINSDIQKRKYTNNDNYYIKKFSKNIKFLINDQKLLDIILNIRFIMKYDYEKYTNIINYIDNFYKIYMYILANRYDIKDYFTTFLSLRDSVIKEMYSVYVILPIKMENYYGFSSFEELKKSITDFIHIINILIQKNYIVLLPNKDSELLSYKLNNIINDMYFMTDEFNLTIDNSCRNLYYCTKFGNMCDITISFDTGRNYLYMNDDFINNQNMGLSESVLNCVKYQGLKIIFLNEK